GMFLFMPFAAVLLRWFFARKRFYWEHLIFSIHIHTVNFMILGLITAVDLIREFPVVDALVFPLCLGYLLLALKRVYQRTWPSTIARLCLMVLPYFLGMLVLILVIPLFAGICSPDHTCRTRDRNKPAIFAPFPPRWRNR
ncbi:MAG TPA: hypothetical protein PLP28_06695, partial [Flavobacteriales bacterium]|nr:hypothetical protein [Flavobacteriales bacterium]